jgi:hypothetical protein
MLHEDGGYEIFMTPEDFVRSLTPGVMQPRRWGLDKFKVYNPGVRFIHIAHQSIFSGSHQLFLEENDLLLDGKGRADQLH